MSHAVVVVAVDGPGDKAEEQVAHELAPFEESEFFGDGSRWDWWVIGGRWDGFFMGKNIIQQQDINPQRFLDHERTVLIETYEGAAKDDHLGKTLKENPNLWEYLTGIKPGETLEDFLKRRLPHDEALISAYAFLKNRKWYENTRMGWWGMEAETECKVKGSEEKVCIYRNEKMGSAIFNFNDDKDYWGQRYYKRFIKNLRPNKYLVAVDYHV